MMTYITSNSNPASHWSMAAINDGPQAGCADKRKEPVASVPLMPITTNNNNATNNNTNTNTNNNNTTNSNKNSNTTKSNKNNNNSNSNNNNDDDDDDDKNNSTSKVSDNTISNARSSTIDAITTTNNKTNTNNNSSNNSSTGVRRVPAHPHNPASNMGVPTHAHTSGEQALLLSNHSISHRSSGSSHAKDAVRGAAVVAAAGEGGGSKRGE
jgi:hypothetical protein